MKWVNKGHHGGHNGYGYGHIDGYLNAEHGYGYDKVKYIYLLQSQN